MNDSYKQIIEYLETERDDIQLKINQFNLTINKNLLKVEALIDSEKNKIV